MWSRLSWRWWSTSNTVRICMRRSVLLPSRMCWRGKTCTIPKCCIKRSEHRVKLIWVNYPTCLWSHSNAFAGTSKPWTEPKSTITLSSRLNLNSADTLFQDAKNRTLITLTTDFVVSSFIQAQPRVATTTLSSKSTTNGSSSMTKEWARGT